MVDSIGYITNGFEAWIGINLRAKLYHVTIHYNSPHRRLLSLSLLMCLIELTRTSSIKRN